MSHWPLKCFPNVVLIASSDISVIRHRWGHCGQDSDAVGVLPYFEILTMAMGFSFSSPTKAAVGSQARKHSASFKPGRQCSFAISSIANLCISSSVVIRRILNDLCSAVTILRLTKDSILTKKKKVDEGLHLHEEEEGRRRTPCRSCVTNHFSGYHFFLVTQVTSRILALHAWIHVQTRKAFNN